MSKLLCLIATVLALHLPGAELIESRSAESRSAGSGSAESGSGSGSGTLPSVPVSARLITCASICVILLCVHETK